jgi:MoxR-like ATPase
MNIKEAKNYIKDTVQLSLKKDEFGEYRIPIVRQRPIFLLGAPGIGKTAIMEQIAQELEIGLVSYSMTHHTRQSALGLPFITQKTYGGETVSVSEYTMSEIIASIYDTMESSGMKEGILFLDEINCVSETLAPSMLQFLQYKVFGRHTVPDGWVVVTAGNPPEYNKSVREFDVVTYDRLKVLEVEADYGVWKEYAGERHLHHAILNYLELKKDHFYVMEMTTRGKSYVTARGWEDLSEILYLYEEDGLAVDETLVGQYLRNERVVKEFTAYYDLYCKYKKDYPVEEILLGKASGQMVERARNAAFDERLSLLGMLMDRVETNLQEACEQADILTTLKPMLGSVKALAENGDEAAVKERVDLLTEGQRKQYHSLKEANALSTADRRKRKKILRFLEDGKGSFEQLKNAYQEQVAVLKEQVTTTQGELHQLFAFVENAMGEGNELLILVTELTVNTYGARFIASFGSPDYQKHSEKMLLGERSVTLMKEIGELEL